MIKSRKKKMSFWKIVALAPVAAALFIFVACQDQVMTEINDIAKSSTMSLNVPSEIQAEMEKLRKKSPDSKFIVTEFIELEGPEKIEKLIAENGGYKKVASISLFKEHPVTKEPYENAYAIIEINEQTSRLSEITKQEGDVFIVVEEPANPSMGMEKFYEFVRANLRYPDEATGAGGKVFIEFIVNEDGTLSDIKVVKGLGEKWDAEAIRVLSMSPPWTPARQRAIAVKQKMVLPIAFNAANKSASRHE